jgi:predicted ATPase
MKYVITGPCASGKTTTVQELANRGYKTNLELIKKLWFNAQRGTKQFELEMLRKRIEIYDTLSKEEGHVFFDRGFLDIVVYRKFEGNPPMQEFIDAARKYSYDGIFVLEPHDNYESLKREGEHSIMNAEQARNWFNLMAETCREYGYTPIIVPRMPIEKRADFILERAGLKAKDWISPSA